MKTLPEQVCEEKRPRFRVELLNRLADGDAKIGRLLSDTFSEFDAGQRLVAAGEPHHYVWRLRQGWCVRSRIGATGNRQIIAVYTASDLLVLNSMFLPVQCDTFEFLTRATLQRIDQVRLHREAAKDHNIALRLLWQFVEEEHDLITRLITMTQCSAEERIIAMLLEFETRLSRLGLVSDNGFVLPMKQQDIGDYVGLSVVHVSRVLRKLRARGIATIARGEARLLDRDRMRSCRAGSAVSPRK